MERYYEWIFQQTHGLVQKIQAEIELSNRLMDRTKQVIARTKEINEKLRKQLKESLFYSGDTNTP